MRPIDCQQVARYSESALCGGTQSGAQRQSRSTYRRRRADARGFGVGAEQAREGMREKEQEDKKQTLCFHKTNTRSTIGAERDKPNRDGKRRRKGESPCSHFKSCVAFCFLLDHKGTNRNLSVVGCNHLPNPISCSRSIRRLNSGPTDYVSSLALYACLSLSLAA